MTLNDDTLIHLAAHHRNFEEFTQQIIDSHPTRFNESFWRFIEQHIRPLQPQKMVDFGAGPGLFLIDLHRKFPNTQLIGIEAQPIMLSRAEGFLKPYHAEIRLIQHDLTSPQTPGILTESIDAAFASMVLHEMQLPNLLIDEAQRVLKPNGIWVVFDWVRQPLATYFEGNRPETLDEFTHFSEHCRMTPEDWIWLIEKSGFELLEAQPLHDGKHCLIALRRK